MAAAALAAVVLGCEESLVTPGSCPALCPAADVELVDTVFTGLDTSDVAVRGFWTPFDASILVVSDLDSLKSVALIRYQRRPDTWLEPGDTIEIPIGAVDSVVVEIRLGKRDTLATNLRLLLYRLPVDFDSSAGYDALAALLADSTLVDSIAVPDSVTSGLLTRSLSVGSVTPAPEDSGVVALGIALRADLKTMVTLASADVLGGASRMRWFVHGPTAADTLKHTFNEPPTLDFFATSPVPVAPAGALAVGNLPSARSLVRLDLPQYLLDSTTIVRATLVLSPLRPATGAFQDPFIVEARPVIRDFGAKSTSLSDTSVTGRTFVTPGNTDPIEIDIGGTLRFWASESGDSLPRTLLFLTQPEAANLGEVVVAGRSYGAALGPRLHVTYVRPYRFGVP
jgi:hypothetical protein